MRGVVAEIDSDALRHNFRLLSQHAGNATVMAVVKANAYGHGLAQIVPTLANEGCQCFAVTDAGEGRVLRGVLQSLHVDAVIVLLAGIADQDDARLAVQHQLSPVLIAASQISLLNKQHFSGKVWLKIDTGMARTGADDPHALRQYAKQCGMHIVGVLSHLACADTPEHPLNGQQIKRFAHWRGRFPALQASLLNSAGILTMPKQVFDVVRPGIGLYGIEPCQGMRFGFRPVMHLFARVVQTRQINAGESIGYGASFIARQTMTIGIVGAGYGDGIPRALSNRGVLYNSAGEACPIVGRVCMDYCMVDLAGSGVRQGDALSFWNATHLVSTVASDLATIAYELLTGVGSRVHRQIK